MADNTPATPVVVIDKPWYASRTILTQAAGVIVAAIVAGVARFGFELSPEAHAIILEVVIGVMALATIAIRKWWTGRTATVHELTTAIEVKGHQVEVKPVKPERHVYKRSEDGGRR